MGKRRKYGDDYKNDAVRLALEKNNASAAARELNASAATQEHEVSERTLQRWVRLHKKQTSRS